MSRSSNTDALARRWDERARENAEFYIKCDLDEQTPEQFDQSGEDDVAAFVDPWLDQIPARDRALDIGCGVGRLTRPLAQRFARVDGVDISAEMVRRARSHRGNAPSTGALNVGFHEVSGTGDLPFEAATFDLVFSYIVLQHVPTLSLVERYLQEAMRVLKPNGLTIVQLNTLRRPLRERLTVRVVPSEKVPVLRRKLKIKVDPHDHMGVTLTEAQCRRAAAKVGGEVLRLAPLGEQYTWFVLRA